MRNTPPPAVAATNPRFAAVTLLAAVLEEGRTLDEAQANLPASALVAEVDVGFVRHLVLSVLRHLGQLDAVIARHLESPLPPKHRLAQHALRLGVAQLLLLDTPAHAAVHATVEAVKIGRSKALAGLVNAVLQKVAGARPALPSPGHNLPGWWGTRIDRHYGVGTAKAIAAVAAQRPPLDLNLPAPAMMESGIRLDHQIWRLPPDHAAVETLPGFAEGAFFVQDIAASYPARLLGEVRGLRVLDACAAPGGKTMQLARAGAFVTALDRSSLRLQRVQQNLTRMQLAVTVVEADALHWEPAASFDAILLDAPCSATGTWRRHPEVLHLATLPKIAELAALQQQLLARAWQWLKPGGRLVYCTCSLEAEEGEQQITAFLAGQRDARLLPAENALSEGGGEGGAAACLTPKGYLRTLPSMLAEHGGMDGFFAAVLVKN